MLQYVHVICEDAQIPTVFDSYIYTISMSWIQGVFFPTIVSHCLKDGYTCFAETLLSCLQGGFSG